MTTARDDTPTRFEPPVGAESGPFWDATREGRLLVQWCTACGRGVFYPRAFCPHCAAPGSALEWRTASGRATVYAAVVEHKPEAARVAFVSGLRTIVVIGAIVVALGALVAGPARDVGPDRWRQRLFGLGLQLREDHRQGWNHTSQALKIDLVLVIAE